MECKQDNEGLSSEHTEELAQNVADDFDFAAAIASYKEGRTPFHEQAVKSRESPSFLGVFVKNPLKSLGGAYDKLDRKGQQKLMYVLQGVAAMSLLAGGVFISAAGGAALTAGGLMTTGLLNGTRTTLQYAARNHATSESEGSRVEKINSMVSGSTNLPLALSLFSSLSFSSIAGVSSVLAYTLRSIKYALEEEEQNKQKILAEKRPATEFEKTPVQNTDSELMGMVKSAASHLDAGVQKSLVTTGHLIQKFKSGQNLLDKGPGTTMIARGALQLMGGGATVMALGPAAGAPLIVAGLIYVLSATVMKRSDHKNENILGVSDELKEDKNTMGLAV